MCYSFQLDRINQSDLFQFVSLNRQKLDLFTSHVEVKSIRFSVRTLTGYRDIDDGTLASRKLRLTSTVTELANYRTALANQAVLKGLLSFRPYLQSVYVDPTTKVTNAGRSHASY